MDRQSGSPENTRPETLVSIDWVRFIIKYNPNAIAVFDTDMRYLLVSDRFLQDYNVKEEDIIGKNHYEVFPEMPQFWKDVHRRVLAGAIERNDDDSFERLDGSITYNRWECRPWYKADGSIGGLIMYTEVTTERKRTEKALQKSEARFRELFDGMIPGAAILEAIEDGSDFIIIDLNKAGAQICQADRAAVLGHHVTKVIPDVYKREVMEALARVSRTGKPEEFPPREYDHGPRPLWLTISLFRLPSGEIVAIFDDVTERHRLEEQLRQAQKMESVGRLAGGVAHDFNNLLTIINGYSDLILGDLAEDDPLRSPLAEIRKAGERAAGLTRQLLAFSRKQVLELKPVNLSESVREIRTILKRVMGEDIEVITEIAPSVGKVLADPGMVQEVLMNLATNARDAMPEGGTFTISVADIDVDENTAKANTELKTGFYVLLSVSDTGMGMDAETRKHIFEPFFTTKSEGKGTGLGLSSVYGFVRQCGGWVHVDSSPGQGTKFDFYLPRAETIPHAIESAPAAASLRGSETVLVVEDQEEVRTLVVKSLRGYGYRVLAAAHGEDAIQISNRQQEPIHLLLTDVIMPRMTGKVLAEHLRRTRPQMKVLYMSGYAGDVIAKHGVLEPGSVYIQKPLVPRLLALKVRELLGVAEPKRGEFGSSGESH